MHVPRGVPALALLIFSTVCGTACTRGPFFTFGSVLGVCIMYSNHLSSLCASLP